MTGLLSFSTVKYCYAALCHLSKPDKDVCFFVSCYLTLFQHQFNFLRNRIKHIQTKRLYKGCSLRCKDGTWIDCQSTSYHEQCKAMLSLIYYDTWNLCTVLTSLALPTLQSGWSVHASPGIWLAAMHTIRLLSALQHLQKQRLSR